MKRLLIVAAIAVIAAPALAGSDILPIDGVGYLRYDVATGQVTPVTAETRRLGPPIWEASYDLYVNYFWGADPFLGEGSIDWADVATGVGVGGLGFSEFTNSQEGDGDLYAILLIYQEENGEVTSSTTSPDPRTRQTSTGATSGASSSLTRSCSTAATWTVTA